MRSWFCGSHLHRLVPPHVQRAVLLSLDVELSKPLKLNLVHHQLLHADVPAQKLQLALDLRSSEQK